MSLQRLSAKDPSDDGPGKLVWMGRITLALARCARLGFWGGAVLGVAATVEFHLVETARRGPQDVGVLLVIMGGIVSLVCALLGGALVLKRAVDALRSGDETFFGFCAGSRGDKISQPLELTDWLHAGINQLAGHAPEEPPLTIGELTSRADRPSIDFRMVTTNLSHARPYIFPREDGSLLFNARDLERLFPPSVMAYLINPETREEAAQSQEDRDARKIKKTSEREHDDGVRLPKDFHPLPSGGLLPVIVATRLSLSFPLLLSAVRLYSVRGSEWKRKNKKDPTQLTIDDLDEHWFSDGGIAANFPLSMFDRWMPSRPTFGINLCDGPVPARFATLAGRDDVFRLNASDTAQSMPRPAPIRSLPDLLFAMLDTARSSRDNAQMGLASYRERVAHIYLQQDEGGLNLDMSPDTLAKISEKGSKAADAFLGSKEKRAFDMREHRWVRLNVLMNHLERELFAARDLVSPGPDRFVTLRHSVKELFDQQLEARNLGGESNQPWYGSKDDDWCIEAQRRMDALFTLIEAWDVAPVERGSVTDKVATFNAAPIQRTRQRGAFFQIDPHAPPQPAGALRVTSEI